MVPHWPGLRSRYTPPLRTLENADGVLLFTPESYEPEAVAAVRGWFRETDRQVYACGPLLPSASKAVAVANERKLSKEAAEIQAFLDEALRTSGEKSVVYVSPRLGALVRSRTRMDMTDLSMRRSRWVRCSGLQRAPRTCGLWLTFSSSSMCGL